jgi:Co/Zn/Cd efflux system component
MAGCCHHDHCESARADGTYRRVLWAALAINAVMFGVEGAAGILSGSVALKADALDFLGDAANYGISLYAVGQAVHWRSRAALAKAAGMGLIGLWVLGEALYRVFVTGVPDGYTMDHSAFLYLMAPKGEYATHFSVSDEPAAIADEIRAYLEGEKTVA